MPRCPNCRRLITYLIYRATTNIIFCLDDYGEIIYHGPDEIPEEGQYLCPFCHEELFDTEEEAEKFLREEYR